MGPQGSQLQHGLVDAELTEPLGDLLSKLEGHWNKLEQPYNSSTFPYLEYKALLRCYCWEHASWNSH